jgi:hypothetical protein
MYAMQNKCLEVENIVLALFTLYVFPKELFDNTIKIAYISSYNTLILYKEVMRCYERKSILLYIRH